MTQDRLPRAALVTGAERAFGEELVEALDAAGYMVARCFADAAETLDLLIVNSPVRPHRIRFRDMTDADFALPLQEQLYEFVAAVQFAAPRMTHGGAVVQIASNAHLGTWDGVDTAAAGGACVAMARSMALELGPMGIRVNTLAPDFVGERWDTAAARRELAATAMSLAGPAGRLISGEAILLNAGRSLKMALASRRS